MCVLDSSAGMEGVDALLTFKFPETFGTAGDRIASRVCECASLSSALSLSKSVELTSVDDVADLPAAFLFALLSNLSLRAVALIAS